MLTSMVVLDKKYVESVVTIGPVPRWAPVLLGQLPSGLPPGAALQTHEAGDLGLLSLSCGAITL